MSSLINCEGKYMNLIVESTGPPQVVSESKKMSLPVELSGSKETSPPVETATEFCNLLIGGMVDIYVGPSKKQYQLHKALICARSSFFRNAFSGSFKEAEGVLVMAEDTPAVFDLAVQWLYSGNIDPMTLGRTGLSTHLQLFVLADKLQMAKLQECIIASIRKGLDASGGYMKSSHIIYIFNNTPPTSSLRNFAVDLAKFAICIRKSKVENLRSCFEEVPDFAIELTKALQAAFPEYYQLIDPRTIGTEWGTVPQTRADEGNSMRANVSQDGSEDYQRPDDGSNWVEPRWSSSTQEDDDRYR
ncbi:MAG: hypothetical protein M1830_009942 [Pleopsidium flavum]|nr:MAG: hypothetical protein M1830_009942 [Pleopsidium flavum]